MHTARTGSAFSMGKMISSALIFLVICICQTIQAQTFVLDHAASFSPAWTPGATSGTASLIGGSTINCTLTTTNSGSSVYVGPNESGSGATPTVSTSVYVVGGSTSNLEVAMNFTTNTEFTDIVYAFSGLIKNVTFNIADIDKPGANSTLNFDQVTVTASDGTTTFNPTITKFAPASNFVTITGNTASANTTSGQGGNSASTAADQNGTVIVDFGTTPIKTITIHYTNATGANSNPSAQSISVGNISFADAATLPLTLTSFSARRSNNDAILGWTTENEIAFKGFTIERSATGSNFNAIGEVDAIEGSNKKTYSYTDFGAGNSASQYYYRLKMVDKDGSFTLSPIISVKFSSSLKMAVTVSPNPVSDHAFVNIRSDVSAQAEINCFNASGQAIFRKTEKLVKGENLVNIDLSKNLVSGWYVLQVKVGNQLLNTRFAVAR